MSMQQLTKDFSSSAKGFYEEIGQFNAENECTAQPMAYFAAKAREDYGLAPDDATLRRREQHYLRKYNVQEWEPNRAEKVIQFAADSWALEAFFAEHKCPLKGSMSPSVEKAFTTGPLQGTFPLLFDQTIYEGTLVGSILDLLVTETVAGNSGMASHTELADEASTTSPYTLTGVHPLQQVSEIGEGTRATQINVVFRERLIPLKAFGFEALASYESQRRARLPVFQRTLRRIGTNFQNLLVDFAIDVLVLGDGALLPGGTAAPSNVAATVAATVAGTPVYADYVNLDLGMPQGYDSQIWVMNKQAIVKMLNVPEFKDPLAGFAFQNRGTMPAPFGKRVVRWDTTGNTTAWPSTATNCKILALNNDVGLIQYTEGGIITESENIISTRWSKITTSTWVGFGIGDPSNRVVGTGFA